jgi:hypothetical protein
VAGVRARRVPLFLSLEKRGGGPWCRVTGGSGFCWPRLPSYADRLRDPLTAISLVKGDGSGLLCGRIVWLEKARDTGGHPTRDNNNPEPAFRRRPLFGKTKTLLWVPRLGSEGAASAT